MTAFHPEVLPGRQQEALRELGPVAVRHGFYLAGGTALALQLGHRQSFDFDWFHPHQMTLPMQLAATLRGDGVPFEAGETAPGTLHGSSRGVRVSFLAFAYPLLRPLVEWADFGVSLASLEDLAAMKLSAIAQRGAKRDFFDLAALAVEGFSLARMIELYVAKFGVKDTGHVLVALAYFDDAESDPPPIMLQPADWGAVKDTVRGWVRDYAGTGR